MIEVNEAVKKAYKDSGAQKEFFITSPGFGTISNDRIIQNSVELTESICSQDNLKFGLCEASIFECQAIDIPNLSGNEITVTQRIYLADDVYYDIPYGKFTVESCKKDTGSNIRTITAYSETMDNSFTLNQWEAYKQSLSNVKRTSVKSLIFTSIRRVLVDAEYYTTQEELEDYARAKIISANFVTKDKTFSESGVTVTVRYLCLTNVTVDGWAPGDLCYFDIIGNLYSTTGEALGLIPPECKQLREFAGSICAIVTAGKNEYTYPVNRITYLDDERVPENAYRLIDSWYDETVMTITYCFPVWWSINSGSVTVEMDGNPEAHVYLAPLKSFNGFPVEDKIFNIDLASADKNGMKNTVESCIEIYGLFGGIGRNGKFKLKSIINEITYPGDGVFPSDILAPTSLIEHVHMEHYINRSLWHEDYSVSPIGILQADCVTSTGEESVIQYVGSDDDNIYYMEDNVLLKSGTFAESEILGILEQMFQNVRGISYYPMEIEMVGLPYLEAGDRISINTDEGQIQSLVMRRTLSGEQSLNDAISATGEAINNNEELEVLAI